MESAGTGQVAGITGGWEHGISQAGDVVGKLVEPNRMKNVFLQVPKIENQEADV